MPDRGDLMGPWEQGLTGALLDEIALRSGRTPRRTIQQMALIGAFFSIKLQGLVLEAKPGLTRGCAAGPSVDGDDHPADLERPGPGRVVVLVLGGQIR